jgi:dTDP-4-dehydrorhamnose 3,5-epimerase-like enzyme
MELDPHCKEDEVIFDSKLVIFVGGDVKSYVVKVEKSSTWFQLWTTSRSVVNNIQ